MPLSPNRWRTISESEFPWEREALDYLREALPDQEPFRAWSNFEFITDDGRIYEVDLLLLSAKGLFLVEIKSRPGELRADSHTWVWREGVSQIEHDNPLLLANRKAKCLASLLRRQAAVRRTRLPFIEPVIFCSAAGLRLHLEAPLRARVFGRDRKDGDGHTVTPGVLAAVTKRSVGVAGEAVGRIDATVARALGRAMDQAGIRPAHREQRVGDHRLGELLFEGPSYQDYDAEHVALGTRRRVRLYPIPRGAPAETREMVRRAGAREFQILEGIRHPGILHADGYHDTERGPALVFARDPDALRLDHFILRHGARLDASLRLHLLREIAEAVHYAHGRRLVHRALCPQSILVSNPEATEPTVQVFNWQTAMRTRSTSTEVPSVVGPTRHLEDLVEDASLVYLAPESLTFETAAGEPLDVFSLGAVAYHLFSGQPPATTLLELHDKLKRGQGLQLSDVLDGAGDRLRELIQHSTHPEVSSRLSDVDEFLLFLGDVEDELTRPDEPAEVNPLEAGAGDRLKSGFTVTRRLGRGSTAVALLVTRGDREYVVKVAASTELNDRLRQEAEVLQKLRHQHIVELHEVVELGGLVCLVLEKAGETTLGGRLRTDGPLHLEWLQRFGEDLLTTVDWLEEQGIPHRDIKPENIGVTPVGRGDRLHVVLFDFSLSHASTANILAGTPPYLEPFLEDRQPPQWDLNAERFAAGVTLYEMATGKLPSWGDGQSNPALLACEVTIDSHLFDPALRDRMTAFFERALARAPEARFDNAEQMLRAWRSVFADAAVTPEEAAADATASQRMIAEAGLDSPLTQLGLSTRALNALDRLGCVDVRGLLRQSLGRVYAMPGVGHKTRREIADLATLLGARFPDAGGASADVSSVDDASDDTVHSLDLLEARLLPRRGGRRDSEGRVLKVLLGLDEEGAAPDVIWPSQTDVAAHVGLTRARVSQLLGKARARWSKDPSFTRLRQDVAALVASLGSVMSATELATALLSVRGSVKSEPRRSADALAVARAAVETESSKRDPRFVVRRTGARRLVATTEAWADYGLRLGNMADRLVEQRPLPSPTRVVEQLQELEPPDRERVLAPTRLVRLAAAASEGAAVSSRLELYPRGMAASDALRLSQNAIPGVGEVTLADLRERVASRYPDAEPLPDPPLLDDLLRDAGWDVEWIVEAAEGSGAYRPRRQPGVHLSTVSGTTTRYPTRVPPVGAVSGHVAEARQFDERLHYAAEHGQFLILTVSPRDFRLAERALTAELDIEPRSLERALLDAMKLEAERAGADWNVVLRADADGPGGGGWQRLIALVRRAMPAVEDALSGGEQTLLLLYPGLLARYGQLDLLQRLGQRIGQPDGPHGVWVLTPGDEQSDLPLIDGAAVPVITPGQWARIPKPWLQNLQRASEGSA